MPRVLVSGLVNLETTLKVNAFPLRYFPVRYPFFGVSSSVSGVGTNVAKALRALGDAPLLLSLVATDVHAISSLDDPCNADFLKAAHVVFLSDESLPVPAAEFARELGARFAP